MSAELIVALDVPTVDRIGPLVDALPDAARYYKVGLELFVAEGPAALAPLRERGKKVFLDLKLHDIPRTVARAVTRAANHGVALLTVHAGGGRGMLTAAAQAAQAARQAGERAPRLVAVTTLTSLDRHDLAELGVKRSVAEHTAALGRLAIESGVDGLVCSPLEAAGFRRRLGGEALLVTPGVRPAGAAVGDQKRVATPSSAVRDGASHLVVGRPILQASDPAAAAEAILREMHVAEDGEAPGRDA